jgi:hypothetical protein
MPRQTIASIDPISHAKPPRRFGGAVRTRLVVLELRHRFQLILGGVEDRVIGIPFLGRCALGSIGAIDFAGRGAAVVDTNGGLVSRRGARR